MLRHFAATLFAIADFARRCFLRRFAFATLIEAFARLPVFGFAARRLPPLISPFAL